MRIDVIIATYSWDTAMIDHHEYATGILFESLEFKMSLILLKWKPFRTCQHVCFTWLQILSCKHNYFYYVCYNYTLINSNLYACKLYWNILFWNPTNILNFYIEKCSLHISWSPASVVKMTIYSFRLQVHLIHFNNTWSFVTHNECQSINKNCF